MSASRRQKQQEQSPREAIYTQIVTVNILICYKHIYYYYWNYLF